MDKASVTVDGSATIALALGIHVPSSAFVEFKASSAEAFGVEDIVLIGIKDDNLIMVEV